MIFTLLYFIFNSRPGVEVDTDVWVCVDNAKTHVIPANARGLPLNLCALGCKGENITVIFFDPNDTSVNRPRCDMGIIAAIKAYYRQRSIS